MELKYIGNGEWLHGVPARDLTAEDLAKVEATTDETVASLLDSGLYKKVTKKTTKKKSED